MTSGRVLCHTSGLQCRAEGKEGRVKGFQLGTCGRLRAGTFLCQVLLLYLVCSFPEEMVLLRKERP